ncbi:MAG: glycosyltransferase family 9 protein [Bacteroidota bacterium]
MPKFLVIRFSSIGDIVLTSPVVRMLKQQVPNSEVHFLTKQSFLSVVANNPFIDKVWTTDGSLKDVLPQLKMEQFDEIIDLHANLRTWRIKQALKVKSSTFNKLNFEKWLLVNLKINRLPAIHIVNRYLKTIEHLGVVNDGEGLNFYLDDTIQSNQAILPALFQNGYWVAVIGANHATKRFPTAKWIEVIKELNFPVVIVGDKNDAVVASEIEKGCGDVVYNACGKYSLLQSAAIVSQAKMVITNDTGMMHIAAAFHRNIISLWGNTVPAFGMTPFMPDNYSNSIIVEAKEVNCRPCSKIGFAKCPKGHFDCMNKIKIEDITVAANRLLNK